MKILVVGNGAREHALCWKIAQSPRVSEVLCAPGNPGIGEIARLVSIPVTAAEALAEFAAKNQVNMVVIGPEAALDAGVADAVHAKGIPVVGPFKRAAQLEASKSFAKQVMVDAGVPTATYQVFTDESQLRAHCKSAGAPLVLKSDGLASGKGVFVVTDEAQFEPAITALFGRLGATTVVAEEFLEGVEVSCIFATNGVDVVPLAPAHDYKRLLDKDLGPNTGGMGAVCPSPRISEEELTWVADAIARPVIATLKARGTPFSGFLYAGLMVPAAGGSFAERTRGIRVLEYNARLGDPECQAILVRLESDIIELFEWISGVSSTLPDLLWHKDFSTCVVVASDGYPDEPKQGDAIDGVELVKLVPRALVFQAATALDERGTLVSTGGRTLSVVGLGDNYEAARSSAYKGVDLIQLRGRRVRRDIGR
jgi:phosphoribosylamine--glycine ligase